jgi:hypothetical protein
MLKLVIDKNVGLEWSFKYSKNVKVTTKSWYSKKSFYKVAKDLLARNDYSILISNTMVFSQNSKNTLLLNMLLVFILVCN